MRYFIFDVTLALACGLAAGANASQLIDRNAHDVRLVVNAKGEALITYTAGGKLKHVLAWDAINAIAPTRARAQVEFKLDYAGRLGQVTHAGVEDVRRQLRGLRRAGARLEGHGLQGARRLLLGAPGLAADAAELRHRHRAARRRPGSFASRTGPAICRC